MNRSSRLALVLVAASSAALASSARAAVPSFTGIGALGTGSGFLSVATGISADGQTVVGTSANASAKFDGFRWTRSGGIVALGVLSSTYVDAAAGVSGDGSTIVGDIGNAPNAYRLSDGVVTTLPTVAGYVAPYLSQYGDAVSRDGAVVVGQQIGSFNGSIRREAYRWTAVSGSVGLGFLTTGTSVYSEAHGTNADGSVVVGVSGVTMSGDNSAFRWTPSAGMVALAHPTGFSDSSANSVTASGGTIVGSASRDTDNNGTLDEWQAVRWVNGAPTALGDLPGGPISGAAMAVADDGNVVVGYSATGGSIRFPSNRAFLWTPTGGMQDLNVLLPTLGIDLTGWTLISAADVSADGTTIVGTGTNPAGRNEAWIVVIPEPTSLLAGVAGLGLIARRRRQATNA